MDDEWITKPKKQKSPPSQSSKKSSPPGKRTVVREYNYQKYF